MLLDLYDAVIVSGGVCLTEAERADETCMWALAQVHHVMMSADRALNSMDLQRAVLMAMSIKAK